MIWLSYIIVYCHVEVYDLSRLTYCWCFLIILCFHLISVIVMFRLTFLCTFFHVLSSIFMFRSHMSHIRTFMWQLPNYSIMSGKKRCRCKSLLPFRLLYFPDLLPWDRMTCYRHLIIYNMWLILSEQFLLLIDLLVVLWRFNRPAVFLQILLKGVFNDVVPLVLLLCLAELWLFLLFQNHLYHLRITVLTLPGLTVDGCHIVRQFPFT